MELDKKSIEEKLDLIINELHKEPKVKTCPPCVIDQNLIVDLRSQNQKLKADLMELKNLYSGLCLINNAEADRAQSAVDCVRELEGKLGELPSLERVTAERDAALALAERRGEFARRWQELARKFAHQVGSALWLKECDRLAAEEDSK